MTEGWLGNLGSATNQSAVSKDSKAYKASQKKFRENVLAMDYTEEPEGKDNIEVMISKASKEIRKKRK